MSKSGAVAQCLKKLVHWFHTEQRILPWRDDPSLYKVWISEIMLQQTQVATVLPFFERFLRHFPDVKSLARASEDEVMLQWAGLGYYSRARNIRKAAALIVEQGFPQDRTGWEALPGVGPYTAGAILSIALNQKEAILDGNIERVLSRLDAISGEKTAFKQELWTKSAGYLEQAFALDLDPRDFNQALMELGARICQPRQAQCLRCPLKEMCQGFQKQNWQQYPPKKQPKKWKKIEEEAYWLQDPQGRVLLHKRETGQWRAGLWDLPEKKPVFLKLKAKKKGEVRTRHIVTHHKIERCTHVFELNASPSRQWQAAESQANEYRWFNPDRDQSLALGSAFKKTHKAVRSL